MTTQIFKAEVDQLEVELEKLQHQRQELAKFPALAAEAKPGEIAELICNSVTTNAPRLRAIDAAIAAITQRLTTKQSQLAQELEADRKERLQQEVDRVRSEMAATCDCINEASNYLEQQINQLKLLETQLIPLRQKLSPASTQYPYFYVSRELALPKATCVGIQTCLESRRLS